MRKAALQIYTQHFATFDAQVETVMKIFEARKSGTALKPPLDWDALCRQGGRGGSSSTYKCDW
jgi:hypothetical protein